MKELPKRKPIRLRDYNYSNNGAYFITICVKDKLHLLGKLFVGDGVLDVPKINLTKVGEIAEKYINSIHKTYNHISIDKYIIMPNHIHFILVVCNEDGTSRTPSPTARATNAAIPFVVSTFKRFTNKECGFSVFQRSYHDHIVRNEQEYQKIWQYVESNPLTWEKDCFYTEN